MSTGCLRNEIVALEWKNVDLNGDEFVAQRSGEFGTPLILQEA